MEWYYFHSEILYFIPVQYISVLIRSTRGGMDGLENWSFPDGLQHNHYGLVLLTLFFFFFKPARFVFLYNFYQ